ncbi:MAG: S1 RNA-binding domain-containing protein [Phycisphaerales bacterium]|nr:S1 RNA-binding domain-containing protein [Phycisphaerales bacterium]
MSDTGRDKPLLDDALQAEIDQALQGMSIEDLMDSEDGGDAARKESRRQRGQGRELRTGLVVSVGRDDIILEFGPKLNGVVPAAQFTEEEMPVVGSRIDVLIDRRDEDEGLLICSRPGTVAKAEWESLERGQVVEARVTGTNKGGLELEVCQHRAFMPAGQVDVRHIPELSVFVGETLVCEVTKIEREGKGNIVLSRREVLERELERLREELVKELAVGQTRDGTVMKLMPFGAFVDIGGMDGLVHISDLSYTRVNSPEDVVKVGDQVKVKVLALDLENNRISLGMKQTGEDPFSTAVSQIAPGADVTGRVTKLMDFGCFVELAPGVEGLIHISELASGRIKRCADVVQVDQVVTVRVLDVDAGKRRISLSLQQAAPSQEQVDEEAAKISEESVEMRRLREKFGSRSLKGGLS